LTKDKQKDNLFARICVYIAGLFIAALGVPFAINSGLGISPISSFPFVLSLIFDVYIGIFIALQLSFFVLLQWLILRREFEWIQLGQLVSSVLFGFFVDVSRLIVGDLFFPGYFGQLLMLAISIVLLSTGIFLYVTPRIFPTSSEGLILAVMQKIPKLTFHRGKILFDCSIVALAIISSLLFLGAFHGVREGTVLSSIFVGRLIPFVRKMLRPMLRTIGVPIIED
jgi:uncharacterized membrane protein YczE